MSIEKYQPSSVIEAFGKNKGNVTAEYIPGEFIEVSPDSSHQVGEKTEVVDGLPRIGAEAQDAERAKKYKHIFIDSLVNPFALHSSPEAVMEISSEKAGKNAMSREIGKRAYIAARRSGRLSIGADIFAAKAEKKFRQSI
ncbi:MAG: hypothetical protein WCK26_00560 [Candidatus Saccharibacteria bacterium]